MHLGDGTFEFVTKQINATRSAIRAQLTSDDDVRCFYASVHTPEWPIVAGTDYGKDRVRRLLQCGRERGAHANVHLLRAHVCAALKAGSARHTAQHPPRRWHAAPRRNRSR